MRHRRRANGREVVIVTALIVAWLLWALSLRGSGEPTDSQIKSDIDDPRWE